MCLKTKLWVRISDILQKCLRFELKSLDFRHILKKVSGNWTVTECLKSILVRISESHCALIFQDIWYVFGILDTRYISEIWIFLLIFTYMYYLKTKQKHLYFRHLQLYTTAISSNQLSEIHTFMSGMKTEHFFGCLKSELVWISLYVLEYVCGLVFNTVSVWNPNFSGLQIIWILNTFTCLDLFIKNYIKQFRLA